MDFIFAGIQSAQSGTVYPLRQKGAAGNTICIQSEDAAEDHGQVSRRAPGLLFTGFPFQIFSAAFLDTAAGFAFGLQETGSGQDIHHIQQMYHVEGGESPDAELVELIQQYVKELEQYRDEHDNDKNESGAVFQNKAPEWAHKLFKEKYGIKLIN